MENLLGYTNNIFENGVFGLPDSDGITLFTYISATEDSQFSYQLDIDEEKTLATLEMADAPEWMSVDLSSGTLSGLPLANDVGSLLFELKGAYSDGTEFSQSISLTVKEINDAPTIDNSLPTSVSEDIEFGHQFEFSDEEDGSENLVFEITDAPDWMDFSLSGVLLITGTPDNEDVGSHSVTVKVTDTGGASDTKTFTLTVLNTNDAPVIDVGDTTGALADAIDGSAFSHQLSVTDVDVGDSHRFSMSSDKDISWLSLDALTGLLTGSPDDEQVGVYNITFSVEDAAGVASVSDVISLTVQNINDPVYIADGQTSLFRSETDNQYTVLITDEDLADSYTFTATGLPTWMSLDASTGVISGTPTRADDGVYNISITVEDAGGLSDTKTIQITSTSYEYSILGLEDDFFVGDNDRDWIETGGGSDEVYAGAGDDVVKVQGQGDSIIDTGTGDDEVVVEEDWSGTLLLKNGAGSDTLDIHQTIQSMQSVDGTDLKIVFSNGNEILIEDHYVLDANGAYEVGDTGFATIAVEGVEGVNNPFPDKELNVSQGSETSDVFRIGAEEGEEINEDVVNTLFAEAGDDTVYIGGGYNQVIGGEGDDTFYISAGKQNTTILGDLQGNDFVDNTIDIDGPIASAHVAPSGSRDVTTSQNLSYADSVYLEWQRSEVTLSNPREGYFRIEHAGTGSVVDIYDVENLYFSDGSGGYEYKPLTEGQVIGKAHWQGDAAGMDIEFEEHNVSFQVDGDILKVLASATVMVTEEQFETYTLWTSGAQSYRENDYPSLSASDWAGLWLYASEEDESLGVQTFEKVLDGVVIWEGNRTEVDAFEFADGVSVNVINVSTTDLADNPVFDTVGTDGIDLIFGNDGDNLIDGKGGDDIIFGGSGDDVIIGGEGDDVILGGDGADILRGDMVEAGDAAITAWQAAATQFNADNPENSITFTEDKLSIETGTAAEAGNDVILGGDQLDDIESGDGRNFVSSGKADLDGNQQVDQNELDLINSRIEDNDKLLDDDQWM